MQADGRVVKSTKFMLGAEHDYQVELLSQDFDLEHSHYRSVPFDEQLFKQCQSKKSQFNWKYLDREKEGKESEKIGSFELAYHLLMHSLVQKQVQCIRALDPQSAVSQVIVDGGFSSNELFLSMLAAHLPEKKIFSSEAKSGSALGAAMSLYLSDLNPEVLNSIYSLQQYSKGDKN
jgi:hypothetical protein